MHMHMHIFEDITSLRDKKLTLQRNTSYYTTVFQKPIKAEIRKCHRPVK